MVKNGFRVMDSDMHVIEPPDLWQRYIDADFLQRAPKGISRWPGDMQIDLEGHLMPSVPGEWGKARAQAQAEAYQDGYEHGFDAGSQVRALDEEGIDIAVLYPSRGLFTLALNTMDPGLGSAIARAYNHWLYDFCNTAPDRLYGAAMVSPFDVQSASGEARRAVGELGFKGIFLRPNIVNGRNWHDPHYDPLWAEIEGLDVPLGFHEGATAAMTQVGGRFETYMMHHTCCHPMEMMLALVDLIGGGVLERFPRLKVAFLEGNCAWAPWLLWRLDEHFELSGRFESPGLSLEPTEYFRRQCYLSVEADEEPALFVERSGLVANVVFSTDYPHNDSKYPHAIERFLEIPFEEETKANILWDNCARLYNLS
ncbi:MAG: amidohydrolase family protein [Dehalococcoidia bacterium]